MHVNALGNCLVPTKDQPTFASIIIGNKYSLRTPDVQYPLCVLSHSVLKTALQRGYYRHVQWEKNET